MGWEHTARQRRLAPIGEYSPEAHRVVVHDSFQQYRLRMAALTLILLNDEFDAADALLHCVAGRVVGRRAELAREILHG